MRTGETLEMVSQLFHVSAHDVRVANDLSDTDPVGDGDELVVPVQNSGQPSTRPLQYTARSGDTLVTVADRFNVSTEELREWNHLGSSDVGSGDVLYVSEPVRLPPAGRGHVRGRGRSYAAVRRGRGGRGSVRRGGAVTRRGGARGSAVRAGGARGAVKARGGAVRGRSAGGTRGVAHAAGAKRKRR